jgi:hypothetical protein
MPATVGLGAAAPLLDDWIAPKMPFMAALTAAPPAFATDQFVTYDIIHHIHLQFLQY